jgi:hypothetical protein
MRSVIKTIKQNIADSQTAVNMVFRGKTGNKASTLTAGQQTQNKTSMVPQDEKHVFTSTCMKPEYRILNITIELKSLTERYNMTDLDLDVDRSSPVSFNSEEAEALDSARRQIEISMYRSLCTLNDMVLKESQLEQYVIRELRHLQEYLFHCFPPIAAYLRVPFDELINNVRTRTKGLSMDAQCGGSRSKPILSPPTPRKRADSCPSGSDSATSKQTTSKRSVSAPWSGTSSDSGNELEDSEYGFYEPLDA